jgi:hypothetical protein
VFPPRRAVYLRCYTRKAGHDAPAVDEGGPLGGHAHVRPHIGDAASPRDACGECMPSPHMSSYHLPSGMNQIFRTAVRLMTLGVTNDDPLYTKVLAQGAVVQINKI